MTSLKSSLVVLLAFYLVLLAQYAAGQVDPCSAEIELRVSPATPTTSQILTVTAGSYGYYPQSISANVLDNVVSVTLSVTTIPFATLPSTICRDVSIGPLPAGQYVLNFTLLYLGSIRPPTLASTTTFEVVPDTAAAIPTWSSAATLGTSLLVLLSAAFWFRRRT
jgi:hypothetical protein